MKVRSLLALCSLMCSVPAWSQAHPPFSDVPSAAKTNGEFFGGFSFAGGGFPREGGGAGANYGFNGGLDFRLFSRVSLVIDVSQLFHHTPNVNASSDTAFLFGPRYLLAVRPNSRASVYGEFLAGGDTFHNSGQAYTFQFNSATTFALAAKGGLDYAWTRHMSTRLEGGYLHSTLDYSTYGGKPNPATVSNNRGLLGVDVVYRF